MFLFRHENSLNLEFYNKVHGPKYADEPYLLVSTAWVNCKTATLKLVIYLFIYLFLRWFFVTLFFFFFFFFVLYRLPVPFAALGCLAHRSKAGIYHKVTILKIRNW